MSDPTITHHQVLAALEDAGFSRYSETSGSHVRMQWPSGVDAYGLGSIVVPTNPAAKGYGNQIAGVMAELARLTLVGDAARKALGAVGRKPSHNSEGAPHWGNLTEIALRRSVIRHERPDVTDDQLNALTWDGLDSLYREVTSQT